MNRPRWRLSFVLPTTLLASAVLLAALVWRLDSRDEAAAGDAAAPPAAAAAAQIERGAYLARVGNCAACHTARGGAPMAGGDGIETPFGTVHAGNLTPDPVTGIGRWSSADFWRALHHGRSKDGRRLYPAFPYPNYTRVGRADADALHAWLHSLPPVVQPNRPHAVRFPYGNQAALAVWRALYFRPGVQQDDPSQSAQWNRGAYLVHGLGHCSACHAARNALGASREALALGGGLIPMRNWYAPSLASPREAGVADWPLDDVVALLKTGVSPRASVSGPMAEVVFGSTQYLTDADARAMAVFLKALPQHDVGSAAPQAASRRSGANDASRADPGVLARGERLYAQHCADCHGERGEGRPGAYPPLAGNRAVTMEPPANIVRILLVGGFAPSTAGNPRPYGMPPFQQALGDADIAAVASYIRGAWGNDAAAVSLQDVLRYR